MRISTLCTFNDWTAHFGAWGEAGVERVFDQLAIAKIERVYWRGLSGGLAEYPSDVAPRLLGHANPDIFGIHTHQGGIESWHSLKGANHNVFDPLAAAVRIGKERGISVCAWWTIYEEDHGGAHGSALGSDPRFLQRDRHGRFYAGTADFFFPEVREYKLRVLRELLDRGVDGLMLDLARHNATPSADETGVHRFGYNPEICEAFRAQTGIDPLGLSADDSAWLDFKAAYQTDFVREVFAYLKPEQHKAILTWAVDMRRWLALDVPSLAREGLLDLLVPVSVRYSNSPKEVVDQYCVLAEQVKGEGATEVASSLATYFGAEDEDIEEAVLAAEDAGIKEIVHCECDQLITNRLTTSFRAVHLNAPRRKREVECTLLEAPPSEADWAGAKWYSDFFVVTGPDRIESLWKSEFQVIGGPSAFHCRLFAHGEKSLSRQNPGEGKYDQYTERDDSFFSIRKEYIDALGARLYWLGTDRGHLFLDPQRSRRKFFHFVADRFGNHAQQTHLDNSWKGDWQAHVQEPGETLWIAEWSVPWETLGAIPRTGDRWTFQLMREQALEREVSSWFVTTTPICVGVRPYEWGDIHFI